MADAAEESPDTRDCEQILVPDIQIKTESCNDNSKSESSDGELFFETANSNQDTPLPPDTATGHLNQETSAGDKFKLRCDDCGRHFRDLDKHKLTHSILKPLQCPHCNKSYRQQGHLKHHIDESHSAEKNYNCNKCNKKFSVPEMLNLHIETVHDRVKTHICPHCKKGFLRKYNLTCHLNSYTGCRKQNRIKPFVCPHCKKTFLRKFNLTSHLNSYTGCRGVALAEEVKLKEEAKVLERNTLHRETWRQSSFLNKCMPATTVFSGQNIRNEFQIGSINPISTFTYEDTPLNLIKNNKESSSTNTLKASKVLRPVPALEKIILNRPLKKTLYTKNTEQKVPNLNVPRDICDFAVFNASRGGILANLLMNKDMPFHNTNDNYQCSTCNANFSILSELKIHEEMHLCQICGGIFSNLELHISQVHFRSKNINCKVCKNFSHCICHLNINNKQLICVLCTEAFNQESDLEFHIKLKHNLFNTEINFKINQNTITRNSSNIDLEFSELQDKLSVNNYEENMSNFMKEFIEPATKNVLKKDTIHYFPCHLCKQKFTQTEQLQMHIVAVHNTNISKLNDDQTPAQSISENKEQDYVDKIICKSNINMNEKSKQPSKKAKSIAQIQIHECPHCGTNVRRREYLVKHIALKHSETVYKCTKCDKEYAQLSLLNHHINCFHNKEPSTVCKICNKDCYDEFSLKKHILGKHEYICNLCGKNYYDINSLERHNSRRHVSEISLDCQYCHKQFCQNRELRRHIENEHATRLNCFICNTIFKTRKSLLRHEFTVHKFQMNPGKFECNACKKYFITVGKLKLHQSKLKCGPFRFYCAYCIKSYMCKYYLANHIKKDHKKEISY